MRHFNRIKNTYIAKREKLLRAPRYWKLGKAMIVYVLERRPHINEEENGILGKLGPHPSIGGEVDLFSASTIG